MRLQGIAPLQSPTKDMLHLENVKSVAGSAIRSVKTDGI